MGLKTDGQTGRRLDWCGGAEAGGYFTALCIAAHQPGWLVSVRGVTLVSHSGPRSHEQPLADASVACGGRRERDGDGGGRRASDKGGEHGCILRTGYWTGNTVARQFFPGAT